MRTVSQMWRNLPEDEKADYAVRAEPHAARYNRQINLWKIMQKALKRPSSAYIIFLQGVWTVSLQNRIQCFVRNVFELNWVLVL